MEQKRILWITAAVGIFLLVVLGGALIIYSPQTRAPKSIAKSASVTESNGWVSIAPVEKSAETERQVVDLNAEISENPLVSDSTENQNIPEVVSSFNANNLGVNMSEQEGQIAKTGDVTVYVENATVISAKDFSEKSEKTLQPSENVQVESKIVPEEVLTNLLLFESIYGKIYANKKSCCKIKSRSGEKSFASKEIGKRV